MLHPTDWRHANSDDNLYPIPGFGYWAALDVRVFKFTTLHGTIRVHTTSHPLIFSEPTTPLA